MVAGMIKPNFAVGCIISNGIGLKCLWIILAGLFLLAVAPVSAGEDVALYLPFQKQPRYFGLYFQDRKVGWMSVSLGRAKGGEIEATTVTDFSLKVAGLVTRMSAEDRRFYNAASGRLKRLDYRMSGSTGSTRIRAVVEKKTTTVSTTAGGRVHVTTLPYEGDTLSDVFAVELAIRGGRWASKQTIISRTFDPSIMKAIRTEQRIVGRESRLIRGVPTKVLRVEGMMPELGLEVISWYDERGILMETLLAGFLKARWETETQAKSHKSLADFLDTSLIRVPRPLENSSRKAAMRVRLSGVPDNLVRNDGRQTWQSLPDGSRELIVNRETFDPASTPPRGKVDAGAHAENLASTARLQADDPAIRSRAIELARGSVKTGELARRISSWVFANVEKRYTPTFSNASEVMETKVGDCGEHAVLFVALARAAGLPAREVVGIVYSEEAGGFGYHAWAEVFVGRWISVDPSWGQFPSDPTHIAFAEGGMEEQIRMLSLIGKLTIKEIGLYDEPSDPTTAVRRPWPESP